MKFNITDQSNGIIVCKLPVQNKYSPLRKLLYLPLRDQKVCNHSLECLTPSYQLLFRRSIGLILKALRFLARIQIFISANIASVVDVIVKCPRNKLLNGDAFAAHFPK